LYISWNIIITKKPHQKSYSICTKKNEKITNMPCTEISSPLIAMPITKVEQIFNTQMEHSHLVIDPNVTKNKMV
jgi:hypothetical protein